MNCLPAKAGTELMQVSKREGGTREGNFARSHKSSKFKKLILFRKKCHAIGWLGGSHMLYCKNMRDILLTVLKNYMKNLLISIVFLLLITLNRISVQAIAPFTDISSSFSYEKPITFIYERGIVEGYPDGTFRFWKTVNRAELLKIILESIYEDIQSYTNSNCGFHDVEINEWYTKYICFAKDQGIVQGYSDGSFQPARDVNFVEALKITELAYNWNIDIHPNEWYQNFVVEGERKNVLPLGVHSFDQNLNRGDMAEMITRFIKQKEGNLNNYLAETNALDRKVTYDCLKRVVCPIMTDIVIEEANDIPKYTDNTDTFNIEEIDYPSLYINDITRSFEITETQLQNFINNPVPQKIVEEKIVFAVNEDFASRYPDWKERAADIIDYTNEILAKNTQVKLVIEKYMTYDAFANSNSPSVDFATSDSRYYFVNNNDPKSLHGGLTVFYLVHPDISFPTGSAGINFKNGKNFSFATIIEFEGESTLRKKEDHGKSGTTEYLVPETSFFWALYTPIHEIIHTFGIASPEWYTFNYSDETNIQPLLPYYRIEDIYPLEPMATSTRNVIFPNYELSELNAFIVNHNLDRSLNQDQIGKATTKNVIVRVKEKNGNLVPSAEVKVFGIPYVYRGVTAEDYKLLETNTTSSSGTTHIPTPKANEYVTEIIKVSKDGKYGGAYLTLMDVQKTRLVDNSDTHYVDIILQ